MKFEHLNQNKIKISNVIIVMMQQLNQTHTHGGWRVQDARTNTLPP